MSDDETRPIEHDPPTPPPGTPDAPQPPPYAMPLPAGYLPYAAAPPRPRFADQVLGMRAVVAVALACLVIGGLSGFVLGHVAGSDGGGFGRGPGFFQQRGSSPNGQDGLPSRPFGPGLGRDGR